MAYASRLLLSLPSREPEPEYQGHSLRHWLFLSQRTIKSDEANKAISAIGSNSLPPLMKSGSRFNVGSAVAVPPPVSGLTLGFLVELSYKGGGALRLP